MMRTHESKTNVTGATGDCDVIEAARLLCRHGEMSEADACAIMSRHPVRIVRLDLDDGWVTLDPPIDVTMRYCRQYDILISSDGVFGWATGAGTAADVVASVMDDLRHIYYRVDPESPMAVALRSRIVSGRETVQ